MVHDAASGETAVVDPGDAAPALAEAERRGWTVTQVWNTHHHWDHSGGNLAMKEAAGCTVAGPGGARPFPAATSRCPKASELRIGDHLGTVMEIPGHTLGHVALHFEEARVAFVGDTLFAMGCGRLFEGTAEQMHRSLQRLAALADDTALYCGHEYTLANARWAAHAEPGNAAIARAAGQGRGDACRRRDHAPDQRRRGTGNQPLRSSWERGRIRAPAGGQRQLPFMSAGDNASQTH